MDYWNSKIKGKQGLRTYSLPYTLWICKGCAEWDYFSLYAVRFPAPYFPCWYLWPHSSPLPLLFISIQAKATCARWIGGITAQKSGWASGATPREAKSILQCPVLQVLAEDGSGKQLWPAKQILPEEQHVVQGWLVQSAIDPTLRHLGMAVIQRNKCHTYK